MIAWIMAHMDLIVAVLLGLSETLALVFPSETGFGGILAGAVKFLKGIAAKQAPPAA